MSAYLAQSAIPDAEWLKHSLDAAKVAVLHPASNPRLSMLVVAIATALVLVFVVLVAISVLPSKRKVRVRYFGTPPDDADGGDGIEADERNAAVRHGKLANAMTSPISVAVIVVLSLGAAYVTTSTDAYCGATCHADDAAARTARAESHAACVDCHERARWAVVSNVSTRSRMLWREATRRNRTEPATVVDSRRCISCHPPRRLDAVTVDGGLRMSHEEVLSGGVPCASCHPNSGHKTTTSVTYRDCIGCHDSRTASSACRTCHVANRKRLAGGKPATRESMQVIYPVVQTSKDDCGGCHDLKADCDPCHGTRMPHSSLFKKGGHAVNAAFERKTACWKCHDPQTCSNGGCHHAAFDPQTGSTTHGKGWKAEHSAAGWSAGCVCHQDRTRRTEPICSLCHQRP